MATNDIDPDSWDRLYLDAVERWERQKKSRAHKPQLPGQGSDAYFDIAMAG